MENAEQELSFEKFFEAYKEQILPMLCKFEPERRKESIKYRTIQGVEYACIICVICVICLFILHILSALIFIYVPSLAEEVCGKLAILDKVIFEIGIIPLTVTFCLIFSLAIISDLIFRNITPKNFKNKIKKQTMKYILKLLGNIKWHKHDRSKPIASNRGLFSNEKLDRSGLFLDFNQQFIDDEFEGNYKGVNFKVSEAILYEKKGKFSGGVFNGIIISFKYNKKINNRTVITTKGNFTKKQNFLNSLIIVALSCCIEIFRYGYSHWKLIFAIILFLIFAYFAWELAKYNEQKEPLNKITLEDSKFNKRFNVYSSDEVEARYLVTPLFMELLYNLKTAFNSKKLKCSFFNNNLMIAISTNKDVFEIGDLFTPCDNPKFIMQFWKELSSIYKMIEYFKLNEKIYTN